MVEQLSPLGSAFMPGRYGNVAAGIGTTLSDPQPGSIVQIAAWRGQETVVLAALAKATGLKLDDRPQTGAVAKTASAFGIGPGRWLIIADELDLAAKLSKAISAQQGSVTDLTHGRTAIRLDGDRAERVLSKLFAVDFRLTGFAVGAGVATEHHGIFAHIQRLGPKRFDLYVFRSFARSFWKTLCHAAEETGYEVL